MEFEGRGYGTPVTDPESRYTCMDKQPANLLRLQNNNNNTPGRQPNQPRPGPGGRPNGQLGQRGPSGLNTWILVIGLVILGINAYSFCTQNNNTNTNQSYQCAY